MARPTRAAAALAAATALVNANAAAVVAAAGNVALAPDNAAGVAAALVVANPLMQTVLVEILGFSKPAAKELKRQGIDDVEDLMQLNPDLMKETFKAAATAKMPNS